METFDKMKSALADALEKEPEIQNPTPDEPISGLSEVLSSHSNESAPKERFSRSYCESKGYGTLGFLPLEHKRLPPMLYTFPGSGNTWGRLLIEHATGVYTGSVYNDKSLLDALPGEFTCDWRVSAVKVHPHTHTFADLYSGAFHSDNNKCKKGGVLKFERAVLLIRNPFDSIWSEYQRRVTQSHVEGILRKTFDWSRWQANAASLSHSYNEMWTLHYKGIEKRFHPDNILYLRYEDLKNKQTRVRTLKSVAKFLGISLTNQQHIEQELANDERFECAFVLSESTQAHRSINPEIEMTKEVAYTKELSCRMYNLFGKFITEHNYTSWKNWDCEGYPSIQRVNVGPRGEYNREWVRPGQQPVDFGGHEASEFDPNAPRKGAAGGRGAGRGAGGAGRGGPGRGRGGQAPRAKMAPALGAADVAPAMKSESALPARPNVAVAGTGMTMAQATHLDGVGKLGESKPAWE
jgi:hypothetical protein